MTFSFKDGEKAGFTTGQLVAGFSTGQLVAVT